MKSYNITLLLIIAVIIGGVYYYNIDHKQELENGVVTYRHESTRGIGKRGRGGTIQLNVLTIKYDNNEKEEEVSVNRRTFDSYSKGDRISIVKKTVEDIKSLIFWLTIFFSLLLLALSLFLSIGSLDSKD